MSAPTTVAPPPVRQELVHVAIEDDAAPLVRQLGRTLREAVLAGHPLDELSRSGGTVAVRSHDTPQAATITLGATIEVSGGVLAEPDATVVVDLHDRFAATEEPTGDAVLAAGVLRALRRPLPHWREAAARFWQETRAIPGIPDVLVVHVTGPDGPEEGRFGEGATAYEVTGPADLLAGVFTGADDFLAALGAGLQVKGTLSQLSVMTAASWKVRFDV
ncbi:hypothetical protein ACFFOS_10050 [Nocardioides kongjuensis]|uniref:Uncharacterized protein n=1 Tax=Nocardioides kongjuensis TaxID=349522 RepID=A0A852RRV4_9ACTN|nr:hypothetical protein [Nocardioides kongjuensis]NYD30664.1 hypothetical protein [Nocardioides kongjuensis]